MTNHFYNCTKDTGCLEYRLIKSYEDLYIINCQFKDGVERKQNNCKEDEYNLYSSS